MTRIETIVATVPCAAWLLLISLGGCASMTAKTSLVGTQWRSLEVDGAPLPPEAAGHGGLELGAEGNRYTASAGCNRLLGSYQLAGERLTFRPGPMTRMACRDPLAELEDKLIAALRAVTGYRIAGNRLELLADDKVVARLTSPGP